jgi:ABC-type transporter Mla subunit MlaD
MARTVRIGLLVTIAIVILMVTIFSLGAEQRFWERKVQYETHFTRTGGLQVGSQVSLNGVLVGSVVESRAAGSSSRSTRWTSRRCSARAATSCRTSSR